MFLPNLRGSGMYVDDVASSDSKQADESLAVWEDVEKSHWQTKSAGSRSGHCLILHEICAGARTDYEVDEEGCFVWYFRAAPTKLVTRLPNVVSSEIRALQTTR